MEVAPSDGFGYRKDGPCGDTNPSRFFSTLLSNQGYFMAPKTNNVVALVTCLRCGKIFPMTRAVNTQAYVCRKCLEQGSA
jgi:hypothetical protein